MVKILYVEDEIAHVELTQRTLEDNIKVEFVLLHCESYKDALKLLEKETDIDIVLTDLRLPDGSGLDLLNEIMVVQAPPAVVLVTGQGDEQVAVAALKAGAADYLVKQSDYLHRLPVVITNAVAQNNLAREQAAKLEAQVRYQSLVEQTPAVVFLDDADETETTRYISPRIKELTGFSPEEWRSNDFIWENHIHPQDRERISEMDKASHQAGERFFEEYRFVRKDGETVWIKEDTNLIRDSQGNPLYWQGIMIDITKEKETADALERQLKELTVLNAVTLAGAESTSEDEIIERFVQLTTLIYNEMCGVLLLNERGDTLTPHLSYHGANVSNWTEGVSITRGVTGKSVQTGRPIRLGDVTKEPAYLEIGVDICSELCVPIKVDKRIIGIFNVESKKPNAFDGEDERFLTTVAGSLGTTLERLRLFKNEQQRNKELNALYLGTKSLTLSLKPGLIARNLLTILDDLLGYDFASIYLIDKQQNKLTPIAISPKTKNLDIDRRRMELLYAERRELGQGIIGWVAKHGEPIRSGDVSKEERYLPVIKNIRSELCVPLVTRDRVIGAVNIETTKFDAYTKSDENLLSALANSAAIALENAQLYEAADIRLKEMEAINRLSSSLRTTQSQSEMCRILLDETLDLLHAPSGSVWIYNPTTNTIKQRSAKGFPAKIIHTQLKTNEGIVGHVFSTGESYITTDMKSDPLLFEGNREMITPGFCGAGIPIYSTEGILGVLMVQIESSRRLEDHLNLLATLAEIAGNAIHRADLYDQKVDQVQKLTTLRDIDSAIASSTDLRVTLTILMDHMLRHLKVDAVDILLYHPELQSLSHLCSTGFRSSSPSRPLMRVGEGLAGQAVMKGQIVQIPDLQETSEFVHDPLLAHEKFVSYIGVPLIVKGQIKGVFEIFHRASLSPDNEWMQFMHTLTGQAAIAIDNSQLTDNLRRSNQEIRRAYDTTLEGWAHALELRDRETEGHARRVTEKTLLLASFMNIHEDDLVNIRRGVLLHDIGKMGVPDQILRKTGPLTDAEWVEMKKHPQYAYDLLSRIPYLRPALDIPYCHHKHWDGSGYPRGLAGTQIPLSARIFSIVDIWDALLSDRPYRKAWPKKKVIKYVKEISGTILDPDIVTAFFEMIDEENDHNETG